jgi:hypothetical protein
VTTDPRDALILGDVSDLSESTQEWLAELPLTNTPADVMAQYVRAADLQDAAEERERERRRADLQASREDMAALAWIRGDAAETVTVAERLRDLAALDEIQERNQKRDADRLRAAEADARAEKQQRRIAELERELAIERGAHARTSSQYHEAVASWGRERQRNRSSEQDYNQGIRTSRGTTFVAAAASFAVRTEMEEPPSRAWWELDSYLYGHTPAETIAYLDHCDDYADWQSQQRAKLLPAGVISPDIDPRERVLGFLRRLRGRE